MKKLILTFFMLTSSVLAGGMGMYQDNNEASDILASNVYEPNWFQMLFGLCVVIGLVYLTSFVYQKLVRVKFDKKAFQNEIEVVTTKSLGQNKNLYIVSVNGEYILLGATQRSITYIKDVKPMAVVDEDFSYGEQSSNS